MKSGQRPERRRRPGRGKPERYIQPCLLMALHEQEAYGYELMKTIAEYGFVPGDVPPGMIYRHLRQMEEEGLLASDWQTEESGPARRVYRVTPEGRDALAAWIDYMAGQAAKIERFIARFRDRPTPAPRD